MANMEDYLKWRGDLTYAQSPFDEVDNLILSYLSYVKLDGVMPQEERVPMPIEEISRLFFQKYTAEELAADRSFVAHAPEILRLMAQSNRYKNTLAQNYMNIIIENREMQLAAMEILLEDGTSYIAFRGTDDTIVGWREDFNLSNGQVPSQKGAAKYLTHVGKQSDRPLRVGGHSKGGNLAIYASAECSEDVRERIIEIYCNDGPGFTDDFYENSGFNKIAHMVKRYVPECSIIGMLLKHRIEPVIIASSQKGIMQHDGFSWQALGTSMVHKEQLHPTAQVIDNTLRQWIGEMDTEHRDTFIGDLFSVLEASGASTLTQLQEGGLKSVRAMLSKAATINPESRAVIFALIRELAGSTPELLKAFREELPKLSLPTSRGTAGKD